MLDSEDSMDAVSSEGEAGGVSGDRAAVRGDGRLDGRDAGAAMGGELS